jgi:hypothetical protein
MLGRLERPLVLDKDASGSNGFSIIPFLLQFGVVYMLCRFGVLLIRLVLGDTGGVPRLFLVATLLGVCAEREDLLAVFPVGRSSFFSFQSYSLTGSFNVL